jgi:uncharacterized membrane protein required for colicin V production
MNADKLPVNVFDLVLVVVLAAGVMRGRKHGMSEELLSLLKWLTILIGCAVAYGPVGNFFLSTTNVFSRLSCYLMAYLGVGLVILTLFAAIKRALGGKLLGSDLFGGAEYYLGMGSGFVRFGCMLLVGLALLNARSFSAAEVKARENYQNEWFGSNFFPGLHALQETVFVRSLTGPLIEDYLGFLLIAPTAPEDKTFKQKEYKFP